MGRIFISAAHGGFENGRRDPGVIVGDTTEAQEMILLRDLIVPELRSRGFEVLAVPDELSINQTIEWINTRYRTGDVALEIHAESFSSPTARGATVYYIGNNDQRRAHAELLLLALLRRVPQLPSRGAKPDTRTGLGRLLFCRGVIGPSLLMEVVYLSNSDDRTLLQSRRRDFALGIADGLSSWSRAVSGSSPTPAPTPTPTPTPAPTPTTYPTVTININGGLYDEQGILVNSNAYVPIDLVDRLGINLVNQPNVTRLAYANIVYVRAIDLRDYNIAVTWDSPSRTVILRTLVELCPGTLDRIVGHGRTTETQLVLFLKSNHESALNRFPEIPRLYREEGTIEGINYDIAFCQMCLETNFLKFDGAVRPEQNNFAGLGSVGGGEGGATFPSARLGVRAQIQHLKAYASTEPLVQELVDPRFRFVTRGIAPLVSQLSGRWSANLQYGDRLIVLLRQLYESAGLIQGPG